MYEKVLVHDRRLGFFTIQTCAVWAESDGHDFYGWRTLVPYFRDGVFELRPSVICDNATATRIAKAISDAETWLEAREAIEAIAGKDFFR